MRKIFICPTDARHKCSWEGDMNDIYEHFMDSHEELLKHSNDIDFNLSVKSENILMLHEEEIYLVQQKVDGGTLYLKLRFLGSGHLASKITYHITLQSDLTDSSPAVIARDGRWEIDLKPLITSPEFPDIKLSCSFTINKTFTESEQDPSDESEHEAPLELGRSKSVKIYKNHSYTAGSGSDIKKQLSRSVRHKSVMYGTPKLQTLSSLDDITLDHLVQKQNETVTNRKNYTEDDLPCSECEKIMLPPIYLCEGNHSVCSACKATSCKLCSSNITTKRNGPLEEISRKYLHPCKYASEGCKEKFKYNELLNHQIKCSFSTYYCPFSSCPTKGTFEIFHSHLVLFHSNIRILENLQNECPKDSEFFVVNKNTGIFYCTCQLRNNELEWQVLFCGPKERQFFCEIDFKNNKSRDKMYLKRNKERYVLRKHLDDLKKMKIKYKNAVLQITSYD